MYLFERFPIQNVASSTLNSISNYYFVNSVHHLTLHLLSQIKCTTLDTYLLMICFLPIYPPKSLLINIPSPIIQSILSSNQLPHSSMRPMFLIYLHQSDYNLSTLGFLNSLHHHIQTLKPPSTTLPFLYLTSKSIYLKELY